MKELFHYTTKEGMEAIISSGNIRKSNPLTTMDAAYGTGYYMTDIGIDKCDIAIALTCWNTINALSKVECYLKFEVEEDVYVKCRDNVFLIKDWNSEKIKYIEGKELPNCPDYPCETCEKGKEIIKNFNNIS